MKNKSLNIIVTVSLKTEMMLQLVLTLLILLFLYYFKVAIKRWQAGFTCPYKHVTCVLVFLTTEKFSLFFPEEREKLSWDFLYSRLAFTTRTLLR